MSANDAPLILVNSAGALAILVGFLSVVYIALPDFNRDRYGPLVALALSPLCVFLTTPLTPWSWDDWRGIVSGSIIVGLAASGLYGGAFLSGDIRAPWSGRNLPPDELPDEGVIDVDEDVKPLG